MFSSLRKVHNLITQQRRLLPALLYLLAGCG